jgi:hypothetical protein
MAKRPPVPLANRSPKGPGSDPKITPDDKQRDDPNANLREQGDHANVSQNTTNRAIIRARASATGCGRGPSLPR